MADYNIKSQNTVLPYYLHKTNLDFVTLTYYGVQDMTELVLLCAITIRIKNITMYAYIENQL